MPLYIDMHTIPGVTRDAVQEAHLADVEAESRHGVKYLKYWFNEPSGKVYCLMRAPSKDAAIAVHRDAHGLLADTIVEVEPNDFEGFLGAIPERDVGAAAVEENGRQTLDGGFRTVMFSDLEGSTALTSRLGDEGAMRLLREHDAIVRAALQDWHGREVKHTGDGIMAAFHSASHAVGSAIQVQRAFAARNQHQAGLPLNVRIGLSAGEPIEDANDLFGATVQLAARICSHAQPCQILVANVVAELCVGKGYDFDPIGDVALKGFSAPVRLHNVKWG